MSVSKAEFLNTNSAFSPPIKSTSASALSNSARAWLALVIRKLTFRGRSLRPSLSLIPTLLARACTSAGNVPKSPTTRTDSVLSLNNII